MTHKPYVAIRSLKEMVGDLRAAIHSDTPTLERYREIRTDRRILNALIHRGDTDTSTASTGAGDGESLSDGADPWCAWCDADLTPGPIYLIRGEDDGRWPPAFCSESCASNWGCAAHQDRIYKADDEQPTNDIQDL